ASPARSASGGSARRTASGSRSGWGSRGSRGSSRSSCGPGVRSRRTGSRSRSVRPPDGVDGWRRRGEADAGEACAPARERASPPARRAGRRRAHARLLDVDLAAGRLDLLLDLRGLVLRHAFLDRLRRALDEVLGLLEAEARDRADLLDHLDLLVAGAEEDDVELRLL